ncbi:MAG: B12-binding domain-containing radical SAM protein, partial [Thermodesulfobacteriota bacterium]
MTQAAPHILLINPWIHDFSAYDFWAKPLGLLTLGSILRGEGFQITYIDCLDRFHPHAPESDGSLRYGRGPYLKTRISKPSGFEDVPRYFSRYGIRPDWFRESLMSIQAPDLILITSGMTYWWTGVRETLAVIKSVFPKTPTVLGGIYATLCQDHAVRFSGADLVVSGSVNDRISGLAAEMTWNPPERPADTDIFNPANFDTYPFPAFDLYRKLYYVPILTSVGCPFSCTYCASHILNKTRMQKSPSRVLEEIRYWNTTRGILDFVLYDDAFLVDSRIHAVPILEQII